MANAVLNLSDLNGSNGFVINGIDSGDFSGGSVSDAGDINGDGLDDLIIGTKGNIFSGFGAEESYVVFGSSSGFSANLNLSSLDGSNGFLINGISSDYNLGTSVSSAGDINGDGLDDLIIGASSGSFNGYNAGQSYVVFGSSSGFSASLNLSTLDGSNGFVIDIGPLDFSGISVSSAGDINGDGFDDLIIGISQSFFQSPYNAGQSYVVFGSSSDFSASLNLSSLDGSNGFVINGIDSSRSGTSVSTAGDINGDGFDDLIIGVKGASPTSKFYPGSSYIVFGSSSGFSASLNLSSLNGSNGFVITDTGSYEGLGKSVSSAGDINGDGFDDLIIGSSGSSYVVFGSSTGFGASLNVSSLDGSNGFVINGIYSGYNSSTFVSSAGDINGDGFDDLIIGASDASPNGQAGAGKSYVVFGRSSGFGAGFNVSSLDGSEGFTINGIDSGDESGCSVSSAGDINGDGFDDLIIGARSADPNGQNNAGESYVFFGFATVATTNEDTAVTILVANILRRYTDAEGDTLTITDFTNPNNGTLTLNDNTTPDNLSDDLFIYTPNANFNGTDSFNFNVTDFAGTGIGSNSSATVISQLDTLQFIGSGLTARNLQLTQNGNNLELTFLDAASTKVTLQNFQLENLDNIPARDLRPAIGNILFDGQTSITDSFDVFNANSTQTNLFNKNTVTFLNDLNNNVAGFDNSNDVINGQGGNDIIKGNSGDDLLRGGLGDDTLVGGQGNNVLIGGVGADFFAYNSDTDFINIDPMSTTGYAYADFNSSEGDKILLDKTTFTAITSAVGIGFSNANDFQITNLAATSTAKIVYDPVSGQLFYNQNGSTAGFGSGGLFTILTGAPTLTASDFVVQI